MSPSNVFPFSPAFIIFPASAVVNGPEILLSANLNKLYFN